MEEWHRLWALYLRAENFELLPDLVRLARRIGEIKLKVVSEEMRSMLRSFLIDGIEDFYENNPYPKISKEYRLFVNNSHRTWSKQDENSVEVLEPPHFRDFSNAYFYPSKVFDFIPAPQLDSPELLYYVWRSGKVSPKEFPEGTATAEQALAAIIRYINEHYRKNVTTP